MRNLMSRKTKPIPNTPPPEDEEERDDAVIGVALRWSLAVITLLAVAAGAFAYYLTRPDPPPVVKQTKLDEVQKRESPQVEIPAVAFTAWATSSSKSSRRAPAQRWPSTLLCIARIRSRSRYSSPGTSLRRSSRSRM